MIWDLTQPRSEAMDVFANFQIDLIEFHKAFYIYFIHDSLDEKRFSTVTHGSLLAVGGQHLQ